MRLPRLIRILPGLLAFFALGCSWNAGKIEGTKWSSLAATVQDKSLPAGTFLLEFGSDNSVVYQAGKQKFTGTYALGERDLVTFQFDEEMAGRNKQVQKIEINGDRLILKDSDGTELIFAKSTEK